MTEYTINKLLVLKLENGKTIIYVNGNRFRQCKRLMINIQKQDIPVYDEIDSIDEAADTFKLSLWRNQMVEGPSAKPSRIQNETITPEQEFWGHCSNLQAWYDHDYDTRLLHSNLAFPLLKALVDAGDNDAKRMFKTEILERLESGHPNVIKSIVAAKLLDYFSLEEKRELIRINIPIVLKHVPKLLDCFKPEEKKEFVRENMPIVLEYFKKIAKNVPNIFPYIFKEGLLDYLDLNEEEQLTKVDYPIILEFMKKMSKTFNKKYKYILPIIERNLLASLNREEIKQVIHQNFDAILKDLRKLWKHYPNIFLYFFEEKLLGYLDQEEKKNLVQQHYPIVLKYIQDIKSPDHLIHVFNSRILDYLNPEDKKQLIHQNSLIIFENLHHILKPGIADIPMYYPHIIRYIFEERLFDYLTPTEKEPLIRNNFPILLDCIEKITMSWSRRKRAFRLQNIHSRYKHQLNEIISDGTLVYLYVTVFYAIKGTELINDFLTTIDKSLGPRKHDIIPLIFKEEVFLLIFKEEGGVIGESLVLELYRREHPQFHPTKQFLEKIYRKRELRQKEFKTKVLPIIDCKKCGKFLPRKSLRILLSKGQVYCTHCGRIVQRNFDRKEVEFHPIHPTKKQQFISKNIITCVQCGMRLSADYAFCDKCGTKIVSDFTPSTMPNTFPSSKTNIECPFCSYVISKPYPKDNLCPRCRKFVAEIFELTTKPTHPKPGRVKGIIVKWDVFKPNLDSDKIQLKKGEYVKLMGITSCERTHLFCSNDNYAYFLELTNNLDFIATGILKGDLDKMLLISGEKEKEEKCQFYEKNNIIYLVYGKFPDKKGKWILEQMATYFSELLKGRDPEKLDKFDKYNIELELKRRIKFILQQYIRLQEIFTDQEIPYVEDTIRIDYLGLSFSSIGVISLLVGDENLNIEGPELDDPKEIREMKESVLTAKVEAIAANTEGNTKARPRWIAVKLGFQRYRFLTFQKYDNNYYLSLITEGNLGKVGQVERLLEPDISQLTHEPFEGGLKPFNELRARLKQYLSKRRIFPPFNFD